MNKKALLGAAMLGLTACGGAATPEAEYPIKEAMAAETRDKIADCQNPKNAFLYDRFLSVGELLKRRAFVDLQFPEGIPQIQNALHQKGRTVVVIDYETCDRGSLSTQRVLGNLDLGAKAERKIYLHVPKESDIQLAIDHLGLEDSPKYEPNMDVLVIVVENNTETRNHPRIKTFQQGYYPIYDAMETLTPCAEAEKRREGSKPSHHKGKSRHDR